MLYVEKYTNEGFESNMNIVKSLTFDMSIELILLTKNRIFRKNMMR